MRQLIFTPRLLDALDTVFPPNAAARMKAEEQTQHEAAKASASMGRYLAELVTADADVLDFGCGWGGETLWLARQVRSATGVDVDAGSIAQAQKALAADGSANCTFVHSPDGFLPVADSSFDAVFSTDTFEHVMDLDRAFLEIARVLRPGGRLITRFGPLFYSPLGYHLYWACQVPWAHLLFGIDAIAAKRTARGGSGIARPTNWRDLGLNGYRFADFEAAARRAGFEIVRFRPIPVRRLGLLAAVPGIRDLVIFGIDCHIRKPA